MKLHHGPEESGITFTDADVELAHAAKDGLEVIADVTAALGYRSTGETGECQRCLREKVLRPLPIDQGDGLQIIHICADCQTNIAEEAQQNAAKQRLRPANDNDVIEEAEPEGGDA